MKERQQSVMKIAPAAGVGRCPGKVSSVPRLLARLAKAAVARWNSARLEVRRILVPQFAIASSSIHGEQAIHSVANGQ